MREWEPLFEQGVQLLESLKDLGYGDFRWRLGGGAALQLLFDHRQTKDIDFFVDDPMIVSGLNPDRNDVVAAIALDHEADHSGLTVTSSKGRIDVVTTLPLTGGAPRSTVIRGIPTLVETPEEVLAKKLMFRAHRMPERDVFDLATVWQKAPDVFERLPEIPEAELRAGLAQVQLWKPRFENAESTIQLLEGGRGLLQRAPDLALAALEHVRQRQLERRQLAPPQVQPFYVEAGQEAQGRQQARNMKADELLARMAVTRALAEVGSGRAVDQGATDALRRGEAILEGEQRRRSSKSQGLER